MVMCLQKNFWFLRFVAVCCEKNLVLMFIFTGSGDKEVEIWRFFGLSERGSSWELLEKSNCCKLLEMLIKKL
jgi:hypothetical protein